MSRTFPSCLPWDAEPSAGLVLNWSQLALWEYLITVEQRQVYIEWHFEADMTYNLYNYFYFYKSEKSASLDSDIRVQREYMCMGQLCEQIENMYLW